MVPGISGISISGFPCSIGIRHVNGYHYGRPCQRSSPLDDFHGITIPAVGIGKDGGYHCRLIHPVQKAGRIRSQPNAFKYIMILTGLVFLLIAPENLSTAMLLFGVVCMMMFIGRVSAKKLFGMLGLLALVGGVAVGILMAIPQDTAQHSGTPPFRNLAEPCFRLLCDKEEVPAAKFDIDKDAQIAHARIAIATSHVVGKGPGNSIQRDFLQSGILRFYLCDCD